MKELYINSALGAQTDGYGLMGVFYETRGVGALHLNKRMKVH